MVLRRERCGGLCISKAGASPPGAGVPEEPLLAQATPVLQQLKEIVAELDANKGVDKWVQAAAQKGHTLGDVCGIQEIVLIVAVRSSSLCSEHCGPKQDHVVRHLGGQEHNDNSKNHFDCLVPLKVAGLVKGLDDTAVTDAHYNQWKGKCENHLAHLDFELEWIQAVQVRCAGVVVDRGIHQFWHGEDKRHHPDDGRRHLAYEYGLIAVAVSRYSLCNSEIAVHTYGREKEHAAEEADLVY